MRGEGEARAEPPFSALLGTSGQVAPLSVILEGVTHP